MPHIENDSCKKTKLALLKTTLRNSCQGLMWTKRHFSNAVMLSKMEWRPPFPYQRLKIKANWNGKSFCNTSVRSISPPVKLNQYLSKGELMILKTLQIVHEKNCKRDCRFKKEPTVYHIQIYSLNNFWNNLYALCAVDIFSPAAYHYHLSTVGSNTTVSTTLSTLHH